MVRPIDYTIDVQSPLLRALQGYQVGQQIAENRMKRKAIEQQQMEAAQLKSDLADFANKPTISADDVKQLYARYPKLAVKINAGLQAYDDRQKQEYANQLYPFYTMVKTGDIEGAKAHMEELQSAYENSNDPIQAKRVKQLSDSLDKGPENALMTSRLVLGPLMGDKFYELEQSISPQARTRVQSSEVLPDGTSIMVLSDGNVQVKDAQNNVLQGDDAYEAIKTAREYGSEIAQETSYSRETGKLSAQDMLKAIVEAKVAGAKTGARGEEERFQETIDKGLSAAETIPVLKRSLQLLDLVKTGGYQAAKLRAKQFLGVEGADEGELSYNLTKAALSKLRITLGAQFTEKENKMLQRVEAGVGKSPAANRQILQQGLMMAQSAANRAIRKARKRKDFDTVQDIQELMEFSLSPDKRAPAPAQKAAEPLSVSPGEQTATNPDTGQKAVYRNGKWYDIATGKEL